MQFASLSEYFRAVRREAHPHVSKFGQPTLVPALVGDLFPYADRWTRYWTGYYTTRPYYKLLGSLLHSRLRAAEWLYSLLTLETHKLRAPPAADDGFIWSLYRAFTGEKVREELSRRALVAVTERALKRIAPALVLARRTVAFFLHHDTITGTSRAFVVQDLAIRSRVLTLELLSNSE